MSAVDASVVIVSFNTRDLLERCLASLPAGFDGLAFETIVVDNASRDGSVARVRERFPLVQLIALDENPGFARSTNIGVDRAHGRVIVWLNPDCEVDPGSLAQLVRYVDAHREAGAAGPLLVWGDGRVQPSAQAFPSGARMVYHFLGLRAVARAPWVRTLLLKVVPRSARMTRGYLESLDPGADPRAVDWISGACLASRAEVARRVGPLDEGYFMYCEDTDWCHRVRDLGFEIHYLPGARVVHHTGQSGPSNPLSLYYYYGSLIRYFRRYRPGEFPALRAFMLVAFALRGVAGEVRRLFRRRPHPWWRLVALCWAEPAAGTRRA